MVDFVALVTPPILAGPDMKPANGDIYIRSTNTVAKSGLVVVPFQAHGKVVDGTFKSLDGGPLLLVVTPEGVALEIHAELVQDGPNGRRDKYRISRTVSTPNATTVTWDALIDVIPVDAGPDVVIPAWVADTMAARDTATAAATDATAAKASAEAAAASVAPGVANGTATLDAAAKLPESQVPTRLSDTTLTATLDGRESARISVEEGRYRRVLSELRNLPAGADIRAVVSAAAAQASGIAGAELVLPEGQWNITTADDAAAAVLVQNPNLIIRGSGKGKTRIIAPPSRNVFEFRGVAGTLLNNVGIEDMTIVGAGSASTTAGNQKLVAFNYAKNARASRLLLQGSGLNGMDVFNTDGGLITDVEVDDARVFGILVYRSQHVKVVDLDAHDLTVAGVGHLGLQFKSSKFCTAIRPRIRRIAGYGFYTWDDGLDTVNYADESNSLIDANISEALAGGTYAAQLVYILAANGMEIRGGKFISPTTGNGIVAAQSKGLLISDIPRIQSLGPALSLTDGSFRVNNVHGDGKGVANTIGLNVTGAPTYGSVRNSSFINGAAGGSVENAAIRLESTVSGVFVEHNDFSDYQATKTQRRGMYDRTAAGVNYWRFNKAIGNSAGNKTIPVGSEDTGNITA